MKIGILTVPFNNNYGGFLQAFALKKVLMDMGHEVVIINRRRNKAKGLKELLKRIFISCHLMRDKYAEKIENISVYTNLFKTKYLEPITEEYYTTKELKRCLNLGINCFVVGSDQVWRYKYAKDSIDDFFFSFLKGTRIPRFSYAASMGTDEMEYPDEKLQVCAELLKEFKVVSVREKSTSEILSEKFGYKNAEVVLDPTLLLSVDDYKLLFKNMRSSLEMPYVFTYILDETEDKEDIIEHVLKKRDLIRVNMKAQTGNLSIMNVIEPVEQWLSAIYYSDFVITDSFHGTIFSIIFSKPFIVIGNPQRGMARMTDLLSRMSLESRLIMNVEDLDEKCDVNIDWEMVKMAIKTERTHSIGLIQEVLNNI